MIIVGDIMNMKRKKEKFKWAKEINRDEAEDIGRVLGLRKTLRIIYREIGFDEDFICYLVEDYITKQKEWKSNKDY